MTDSKETLNENMSKWISTYGFLTASKILETYQISLSADELILACSDLESVFYQILKVPISNLLTGIIFQQAVDYQVYAQKLFVDYLLSGEPDKSADLPGGNTREELEALRQKLVDMAEQFNNDDIEHKKLISESQAQLIAITDQIRPMIKEMGLNTQDSFGVGEQMQVYLQRSEALNIRFRKYRKDFFDAILKTNELIACLPDYRIDVEKDSVNREPLFFDASLGEAH